MKEMRYTSQKGLQPQLLSEVLHRDHMELITVLNQQGLEIIFHLEHNITWQSDFHELQHSDVIVVIDLRAIEAFIVRAQVPKMSEDVISPQDLVRGDSPIALRSERCHEQVFANGVLVAPLHKLEKMRHVPEGQVIREYPQGNLAVCGYVMLDEGARCGADHELLVQYSHQLVDALGMLSHLVSLESFGRQHIPRRAERSAV